MRWLLLVVLGAAITGCGSPPGDHGGDVPGRAREALDCPGRPWQQGGGNYDTGPESVQDDARAALDDWLAEEGGPLPEVDVEETARHGRAVLFAWREGETRLGSFVVHEGMSGPDDATGWGVYSYAFCDPSQWPPARSDEAGFLVWADAGGDRVPTSLVYSFPGAEHCQWQDVTFLFLGSDGRDGRFLGHPSPELAGFLRTTYAAHAALPREAKDTGYARDGRELWVTTDAAYLVGADGDAERWPAEKKPIGCD